MPSSCQGAPRAVATPASARLFGSTRLCRGVCRPRSFGPVSGLVSHRPRGDTSGERRQCVVQGAGRWSRTGRSRYWPMLSSRASRARSSAPGPYRVDPARSGEPSREFSNSREWLGRCSTRRRQLGAEAAPGRPLLVDRSDGRFTRRTSPAEAPGRLSARGVPACSASAWSGRTAAQSVCVIVDRCLPLKPGWLHLARRINYSSGGNMVFADINQSLQQASDEFFAWLPKLVCVLVILLIGYIVARVIAGVVRKAMQSVGADRALETGRAADYKQSSLPPCSRLGSSRLSRSGSCLERRSCSPSPR